VHSDGFPANFEGVGIFAEIFPTDATSSTSPGILAKSFSCWTCILTSDLMLVISSQIEVNFFESSARSSIVLSFPICSFLYSVASVAMSSNTSALSFSFLTLKSAALRSSSLFQSCFSQYSKSASVSVRYCSMSFRRLLNCLCADFALLTASAFSISAANDAPERVCPPDCAVVAVVCVLREAGTLGNQYRLIMSDVVYVTLRLECPMNSFRVL
jgi:hypothetical protein